MTARELIAHLSTCDLDKEVTIVISIIGEGEAGYDLILREIKGVIENEGMIGIQ